jgi:hypothetical protein
MSNYKHRGYFVKYSLDWKNEPNSYHYFCGKHNITGAWCPNCSKNLLLFMSIDMSDSRLEGYRAKNTIIPLLYCWTCNISQSSLYYKLISNNKIMLLEYGESGNIVGFPYSSYPEYFPGAQMNLVPITNFEQDIIHKLNSGSINQHLDLAMDLQYLAEPSHQIGGEPYLVQQELEILNCCSCDTPMQFFAAVANNCTDRRGFVGNDYVQVIFYFCRNCDILCATQMCD